MNVAKLIIGQLATNEIFTRKVIPFIKKEYFKAGEPERVAFEIVQNYFTKYNTMPTPEAMGIDLQNRTDLSNELFDGTVDLFGEIMANDNSPQDLNYITDQAETFCQDRALHIALSQALDIMKGGEKSLSKGSIPKIMQDALAVSFETFLGHDLWDDAEKWFDNLQTKEKRVPFDLKVLNKITQGGLLPKTLNVVMAVSGAGKSLFMAHCAAANLAAGLNVLYVTLELSQEKVSERIYANLLDIEINNLKHMPRDQFLGRLKRIQNKTAGKLKVKEYGPMTAGSAHFRHLIHEYKVKHGFAPDVIYVDYINICQATTLGKGEVSSYDRVKRVAEELRALAVELNVPLVSATQTNRSGYGSSEAGMENTSESMGLPMTADLFLALISSEVLEELGQYKVVQLKSRYDDKGKLPVFFIGVNKGKMKLYDLDEGSTPDKDKNNPVPDIIMPGISGGKSAGKWDGFK